MSEVISDLDQAVKLAIQAGIQTRNIIVDPGIGFGKTIEQSLEAQRRLNELHVLGLPVLVGTSRKSSIGTVLGVSTENRMEGTAATVALAIERGADLVRVHDVAKMLKVVRMADAIVRGWAT
jgi:dihydropteroate synthase